LARWSTFAVSFLALAAALSDPTRAATSVAPLTEPTATILTDNVVELRGTISRQGFVHPGRAWRDAAPNGAFSYHLADGICSIGLSKRKARE